MGDWNNLPGDLVRSIEEVIVCYIDKVRFRSVCKWWHSSTCDLPKLPNLQAKKLPWLLYDHDNHDRDEKICEDATHGFMNVNQETYHMYLPEARGKMFKGSSCGWVAVVDDTDAATPDIYLLNPFTRSKIALPPRSKFPHVKRYRPSKVGEEYGLVSTRRDRTIDYHDARHVNRYFIWKIILSAPPSEKDCVAVAIYGGQYLAYCEISRNRKWNALDSRYYFSDVIFHKGKLHAVTTYGKLLVFESVRSNGVQNTCKTFPYMSHLYLVESCGGEKLLMVKRDSKCQPRDGFGFTEIEYLPWISTGFQVYLLDKKNEKWIILKSIGNNMLFLGINGSLSFSSYFFPGYRGNCIYFTDDHAEHQWKGCVGGQDIGVFNLTDKSIKPLPGFKTHPYLIWPPPIWVTPGQSLGA